jgi:hypothetical protein
MGRVERLAAIGCEFVKEGEQQRLLVWIKSVDCRTVPKATLHVYIKGRDFPGQSNEEFNAAAHTPITSGLMPAEALVPADNQSREVIIEYAFTAPCGHGVQGDAQGEGKCVLRVD